MDEQQVQKMISWLKSQGGDIYKYATNYGMSNDIEQALRQTATYLLTQAQQGKTSFGNSNVQFSIPSEITGKTYNTSDISLAKQALIKSGNPSPTDQDAINYINAQGTNFQTEAQKLINMQTQDRGDGVQVSTSTALQQAAGIVNPDFKAASVTSEPTSTGIDINSVMKNSTGQPLIWRSQDGKDIFTYTMDGQLKWISPTEFQTNFAGKAQEAAGYIPTEQANQAKGVTQPTTQPATTTTQPTTTSTTPTNTTQAQENTPTTTTTNPNDTLNSIYKEIDAMTDVSEAQKVLMKSFIGQHTGGLNTESILNTFTKLKDQTVNPYYRELINAQMVDAKTTLAQQEAARQRELEVERANYGQDIRQAKSDLENRGMTFSGEGIETLGDKSAFVKPVASMGGQITTTVDGRTVEYDPTTGKILKDFGVIPAQSPIGATEDLTQKGGMTTTDNGRFYEGTVNQANRLQSSGSQARYYQNLQNLGRALESQVGTVMAGTLGINYTPAGITEGSIETQRQQSLGTLLNQISAADSQATTNLNKTNQQYNFQ